MMTICCANLNMDCHKRGKKLPDLAGKVWHAITAKFKGKPAAEEAVKDWVAKPSDEDNRAAFRKELRKVLEAEPAFAAELERLLESARGEGGATIIVTGSGAAAPGAASLPGRVASRSGGMCTVASRLAARRRRVGKS
jgi:hypothetical protein